MVDDDHYIANPRNAHIDTRHFEAGILAFANENDQIADAALFGHIYDNIFSKTAVAPDQPADEALLCRYLTPAKFTQFLDTRQIAFPVATQFSDARECTVPEDYDHAVQKVFSALKRPAGPWVDYVRTRATTWNISCWTELHDHIDDHLLWETYASGPDGVGITVRYGQLKSHLADSTKRIDLEGRLQSGHVNYESVSLLPFNKHYMFRNEKEVRFAFRSRDSKLALVSIDEVFCQFGVRISPAADHRHCDAIRRMWLKYGGQDRIQHPR